MAANIAKLIEVRSSVVAPVSNQLSMSAVCMSNFYLFPQNKLLTFKNARAVAELFGSDSNEAKAAEIYFKGYDNSVSKPKELRFWKYISTPQPAYLFSGTLPKTVDSLTGVKDGAIRFTINGENIDLTNLDFSEAKTWSDVANTLDLKMAQTAEGTASIQYNLLLNALELITTKTGPEATVAYCADVPNAPAAKAAKKKTEKAEKAENADAEAGQEQADAEDNAPQAANTSVVGLLLLGEGDAHLFQGMRPQTAEENISALIAQENNFTTIIFAFDISDETALDIGSYIGKLNAEEPQFVFLPHTNHANNYDPNSKDCLSYQLKDLEGVSVVFGSYADAALFAGIAGCINLDSESAITLAFKTQTDKSAIDITDKQFDALMSNNVNFYAKYSAKSNDYNVTYPASVNGAYNYLDSFYNAIWLSETIKNDFAQYMLTVGRIPYTPQGYSLIATKLQQIANKGIANQIINAQVTLTEQQQDIVKKWLSQKEINSLYDNGFFFWVKDPKNLEDRIKRLSPDILFIYTYGGAVQRLVFNVYQYQ